MYINFYDAEISWKRQKNPLALKLTDYALRPKPLLVTLLYNLEFLGVIIILWCHVPTPGVIQRDMNFIHI